MPQYTLICLNNAEYALICLNKQSSEYVRILNVFNAVHCKSVRFQEKPKSILYDPQKHPVKVLGI